MTHADDTAAALARREPLDLTDPDLIRALDEFNAGVARARMEYDLQPSLMAGRAFPQAALYGKRRVCTKCGDFHKSKKHELLLALRAGQDEDEVMTVNRVDPCADCQRTKHIAARDLCRGCYKRHRLAGTLANWQSRRRPQEYTRPERPCLRCEVVRSHQGRGLCASCYSLLKDRNRLDEYPRIKWRRAELLEEWGHLRRAGVDLTEAARRLGISRDGLQKAIERAGKRAA